MVRVLNLSWKVCSLGSCIAFLCLLGLLVAGIFSGHVTGERARALANAAFGELGNAGRAPKEAAGPSPEGSPAPGKAAPAGGTAQIPTTILREIERASMDLQLWEDRIDLLGKELGKSLITANEKDQDLKEAYRAWDKVRKAMVPLLNQLLQGTPGWKPITEEEFLAAIAAGDEALSSKEAGLESPRVSVAALLEKLREREATYAEGEKALRGLAPDVLAGILSAGMKQDRAPGSSFGGAPSKGGPILSDEDVARLLATMEPGKFARIFKAIRDEDPLQAAALASLVLKRSQSAQVNSAKTSPAPSGEDRTGADGSKIGGGAGGGEKEG